MGGQITALKFQKRSQERVNVFVDGQYAFAVKALTAARLKKGQYLSDAEIEQLKSEDERDKAYNQAIRFLGYRPRSRVEIKRHLEGKKYSPELVNETIDRLQREQYLDDEAFVRFWLADRARFRPRGRRGLYYELRQKGIAEEVIEAALADLPEYELAWSAVESKLPHWQKLAEEELKKKLLGFLSRRGFSYEVAYEVLERAKSE